MTQDDEDVDVMAWKRIGAVSNYYGGLHVAEQDGKFFWGIENYTGIDPGAEEIPERLYRELIRFEEAAKEAS